MLENDEILHPRPQLARKHWVDLNGAWGFAYDDENIGLEADWQGDGGEFTRQIIVPFPPESPASGVGDRSYHPVVWYRKTFSRDLVAENKRLILHFGAVDYRALVWINGNLVTSHEGGHTPIKAEITNALRGAGEQTVVVRAEDRPDDLAQLRGKQDWQSRPHNIWYERTTGIWQSVWLESVSPTHIKKLRWTPDVAHVVLRLEVEVERPDNGSTRIRVRLELHGKLLADDCYAVTAETVKRDIALEPGLMSVDSHRTLWTPETPNLVQAFITLEHNGETVDEVRSYAGIRSVSTAEGRFTLNARPYYLRMVLEQGYWPDTHLAAPSDDALRREVVLAKALGFNGVRIHQKVESPRFLYWCDVLGLIVWGEIANAYIFSRTAEERLVREWLEVLERDYSHPCIVTWVPLNEGSGVPNLHTNPDQQDFVRAIYYLTKAIDSTRPVIANDGWEHVVSDILSIHDYTFNGETLRQRYGSIEAVEGTVQGVQPHFRSVTLEKLEHAGQPLMLTEFGGISLHPEEDVHWYGYGTVIGHEAFLIKYRELVNAVLDCPTIAGFCYTQLTDTAQEKNGLLDERRQPKCDPNILRAINTRPAQAVPGDIVGELQMLKGTPFEGSDSS